MERLDALLWEDNFFPLITSDCAMRDNSTIAAQWVRLAYHDMSTHTMWMTEQEVWTLPSPTSWIGHKGSVIDFLGFMDPAVSLSDTIAMGTVLGVASCGGPLIPFRGGRVDATTAGPATVPEPQEDLASHTESFRRQGLTQSEMIGLVACGRSLGGVRQVDFPDIIPAPIPNDVALLDGTHAFDNKVITGYFDGTTPSPLVVGSNTTTNSDLRIFASDGNATMQSLASADNFDKVCRDLFERMIDTVPKGVQLTDVVEPMQYKVGQSTLFPGTDGAFRFTTSLRVTGPNPSRTATLLWSDRQGSVCPDTGCSAPLVRMTSSAGSLMAVRRGLTGFSTYEFDTKINMTSSASKFWFKIDEGDGTDPILVDNDGPGLPIQQDVLLFDRARTGSVSDQSGSFLNLVLAVRTSDPTSKVSVLTFAVGSDTDPTPKRETVDLCGFPGSAHDRLYVFLQEVPPDVQQQFALVRYDG
ncbi:hypothetical protein AAF712_013317 [Marasmius tenuissimus]|uniref:Peroxidase n=1 Tax=Marasmius tenuissimus TaxID=585030 RepID=A0ABR2ZF76_9AGAR